MERRVIVSEKKILSAMKKKKKTSSHWIIIIRIFPPRCSLTVNPCSATVCQLRVEFQDLSLAGPSGDGICNTDVIQITGGATNVPNLCGENSGQHVVVDFDGTNPISITIAATSSFTFGRHWFIRATQINCDSSMRGIITELFLWKKKFIVS